MILPLILIAALSQGQFGNRRTPNAAVPPIGKVRVVPSAAGPGCPLYPAVTNYVTYSNTFSDASWLKLNNGTIGIPSFTANAGVDPNGTSTAWRAHFYATSGGGTYSFVASLTGHTGTNTNTLWVRGSAFSLTGNLRMGWNSGPTGNVNCTFSYGYWTQCAQINATSTQDVSAFGNMDTTISMPEIEVFVWQYDATAYTAVSPHITTTSAAVTRAAGKYCETATAVNLASGSVMIGDSIGHLGSPSIADGLSSVNGLNVTNATVSGSRFNDDAAIGPGTTPGSRQQFALYPEFKFKGVLIEGGTNSLNGGSSAATLWADYKSFLEMVIDAGITPVAMTILDCGGYAGCTGGPQGEHASFNGSLRTYAASHTAQMHLADCQPWLGDGGVLFPECDFNDGIHLTQLCYDRCRNIFVDAGVPQ